MRIKSVFLAAILTAFLWISGSVFAVLSGGGTQANPYLIQSRADFNDFANPANAATYWASGVYTKLMCDIDLAGTIYTQAVIAPDTDNTDWDFTGTPFSGIFNGNTHVIANLTIDGSGQDFVGLFGYVENDSQIKNLGLKNIVISGVMDVGGLIGNNRGVVTACYATGSVSGTGYTVGGLVGFNSGMLTACYATCSVTGTGQYAEVGGLVGEFDVDGFGSITSCYATGSVVCEGEDSSVGGLIGVNEYGPVTNCYATGSVTNYGTGEWSCTGGLVGDNFEGVITNCYAAGEVIGGNDVGGFIGENHSVFPIACFWDINTSKTTDGVGNIDPDPASVIGKTTSEMRTPATFTDAGWDFTKPVWMIWGEDYPRLVWNNADINNSGWVDLADFSVLAGQWMESECGFCDNADLTGDRDVNLYDLLIFSGQWLEDR